MKKFLVIGFASLLSLSTWAAEKPDLTLLDLPLPVKITIAREAGLRSVNAITRGVVDSHPVYYAKLEQAGIDTWLTVGPDGSLIKVDSHEDINKAITTGKEVGQQAWEKTKEVAGNAWAATKDTARKAVAVFHSDELTLNQVPERPRATMEREAAGDRLTDIGVDSTKPELVYRATVKSPGGTKRGIIVREDGTLVVGSK